MNKIILHVDFNSYFATIEQQANPRLRGKPIGVTGGDRLQRTVIGAASVEAKAKGVKTGMNIGEALKFCPDLILVKGDSDKYLECTKRFLSILNNYTPYLEIFSIDEAFLELPKGFTFEQAFEVAIDIKKQIHQKIGEWVNCSIGISYCKMVAKFAGSLNKPNGLIAIADPESAMMLLDQVELDEVCGIGSRLKKRLNNMGIFTFSGLRQASLENLIASFKPHQGKILYNFARGLDDSSIIPFYKKPEIKSVGHRHTLYSDTKDPIKIKKTLLKITELIASRLRQKKLVGKTVVCYFRNAIIYPPFYLNLPKPHFSGDGAQVTINPTNDGLEIFRAAWDIFNKLWQCQEIRMVGVSVATLQPERPQNLQLFNNFKKDEIILQALDKINNKYGEFTLQRAVLIISEKVYRKPNPFLADRRFKL